MTSYNLMWSDADEATIDTEIKTLQGRGTDVNRVLAHLAHIAVRGSKDTSLNVHTVVKGRTIHCIGPIGNVGAYYTYASPPAKDVYLLGCFEDHLLHYPTAAARLNNVP
jgi:hypothetical protein